MAKAISYENLGTFAEEMKKKYAKTSDIPVNVSDLTNDAGYQTGEQVSSAVAAAVAAADHLIRKKVDSLDAIDLSADDADKYIYMVPNANGKDKDNYDEYMIIEGALEQVGNTRIDLSGYAQTEQVENSISAAKAAAVTEADANTDQKLEGYVKTADMVYAIPEEIQALFADETSGE